MRPPRSLTACSALPLAGRCSPEASLLLPVHARISRVGAEGNSPRGGAAPAVWQSQPCGFGLKNTTFYGRVQRAISVYREAWAHAHCGGSNL